ncbi:hypothetical protein ACWD4F_07695 [Streptomyces aureus]
MRLSVGTGIGPLKASAGGSLGGCGGAGGAIVGLVAFVLLIPTLTGLFIPLMLVMSLVWLRKPLLLKIGLCAVTAWAWIHLPAVIDQWWYREDIFKASVVLYGIFAALLTAATVFLVPRELTPDDPEQSPPHDPSISRGCYQHPDRTTETRCTRCDTRICPDCMISAPVGFKCPPCAEHAARAKK